MDENNKLDAIIDIHKENSEIFNFSPDELAKRLKKIQKDKIKADRRVKKAQNANFFDSVGNWFTNENSKAALDSVKVIGQLQEYTVLLQFIIGQNAIEIRNNQNALSQAQKNINNNQSRINDNKGLISDAIENFNDRVEQIEELSDKINHQEKIASDLQNIADKVKKDLSDFSIEINENSGLVKDMSNNFTDFKKSIKTSMTISIVAISLSGIGFLALIILAILMI